jgi:RimJ/RimL family protein N-acetyltransferase/uncharacterized damage-inducible protein DinB
MSLPTNTTRIELVPYEPQHIRALIEGLDAYEKSFGLRPAEGLRDFIVSGDVSAAFLAEPRTATTADPWTHGFAVVHAASRLVIGGGGFKGPPGADGVVEIAYGIVPSYQGQGFATETARALMTYAFTSGRVRTVRAHTLPALNASTRVLTKCGFTRVGEVVDPEDGLVWRWERSEGAAASLFLARSRYYLRTEYSTKLRAAVEALPAEALWWRPNEQSNSVGNLLLHLTGNIRQWIVRGVGGAPGSRNRDAEFAARSGPPAAALLADLERALGEVDQVLAGLSPEDLLERRAIQGSDVTVLEAVYHVVEHFALHLGQIVLVAKLHAPGAIKFYDDAGGLARPLWKDMVRPT